MPTTTLLLVTGEQVEVNGSIKEVAKELENASRSGPGTLAWLTETATQEQVGFYPAQVVTVRTGEE